MPPLVIKTAGRFVIAGARGNLSDGIRRAFAR
jgi:hypothetical protein